MSAPNAHTHGALVPGSGAPPPLERAPAAPGRRPALWTRDFLLLLAASVAFYTGFQILLAPMPLYVVHLGGGEAAAGLVTGLFTVIAMLVRPVTGWALDAYGRRAVLAFGTAFCLAAILAQEWAATLGVLIALRMLNGFGFGFATTAGGTLAADLVPRARLGEGMGFYAVSMGLPLGIAPPLGIWLAGRGDFSALFWIGAGVTGVALVLGLLLKAPRPKAAPSDGEGSRLLGMFERTALFPSALMFLLISSFGLILALLALFGKERGIGTVGAWFTVYAVILTLSRAVAGRAADRFGYPQVATAGLVLVAAGLLIMASAHSAWVLLLSAIVYGLGYGTTQPSLQAMLVDRAPVARVGAATAVFFFAYDLGTTVGSVGGGFLAGVLGLGGVFAFSALGPLLALGLLIGHLRRARGAPSPGPAGA